MTESKFQSLRVVREYRQTINAPPDKVFPLLCPVREADWLDGWQYTMIYSESGLVEEGAVFSTPRDGEEDTVWVVSRHDPVNFRVEFVRFTHRSRTCLLKIAVRSKDQNRSEVDIAYSYTGISTPGNEVVEGITEAAFQQDMTFWEDSMNHYLATGERLARPHG